MQKIVEINRSKSDPNRAPYETICHEDGKLMCNCRGWSVRKPNQARTCTHFDHPKNGLIAKHGLTVEDRGEFRYAVNQGKKAGPVPSIPALAAKVKSAPAKPAGMFRVIESSDDNEDTAVFVAPMLASGFPEGQTLENFCSQPIEHKNWVMEEKFDGHRVVVCVNEGRVIAWSRPGPGGKDPLRRDNFPVHLVETFAKLPTGTYDGELMIPGGRSYNVTDGKFAGQEIFVVFDIMSLLGMSTIHESYTNRRSLLVEMFSRGLCEGTGVKLAESVPVSLEFVKAIWARDGEGVILKRKSGTYDPGGRSRDFIKVKNLEVMVMTVTGYVKAKLGPYAKVSLEGPHGEKAIVKTLDNKSIAAFTADPSAFIGRKLRIEFQERTPDGSFRHPRWDRWENE